MKIKKVFKYGTGQEIPEGAIYLKTREEIIEGGQGRILVWHYFLVEVEDVPERKI